MMRRNVGWRYESARHSLAARGIPTGRRYNASLAEVMSTMRTVAPKALPMASVGAAATQSLVRGRQQQLPIPQMAIPQELQQVAIPQVPQMTAPPLTSMVPGAAAAAAGPVQIGQNLFKDESGAILTRGPDGSFTPAVAQAMPGGAMGVLR